MELTAVALFLASSSQSLENLLDFMTIDGFHVSHVDGTAALRNGHAILVGDLLVGTFGANSPLSCSNYAA
ncbi:hypothetical protein J0X19_14610 [Hymenobacter sp. BT186]|uniref:Uncharacterized protein n=1 Tax=Hymenobacter telluris TaxID=2816474 RepID=A0A939EX93_9BACT|nr:hypothetical protein [Hymenobacter telluris]MBW3375216.1 hypothetical protein [Hymenobacter norwichensis]